MLISQLQSKNPYKLISKFVPAKSVHDLCDKSQAWQLQDLLRDEHGNEYYLINVDRDAYTLYLSEREHKNRRHELSFKEYLAMGMVNVDFNERQERLRRQLKEKSIQKKLEMLAPLPKQVSMTRNLLAMGTNDMSEEELYAYSSQLQEAQNSEESEEREDLDSGINQLQWAYEKLGFERDSVASSKEIKRSFYELSKKYHPDAAPVDRKDEYMTIFTEINQAYEVLTKNY